MGTGEFNARGIPIGELPSHPGAVEILLVTSCYRNQRYGCADLICHLAWMQTLSLPSLWFLHYLWGCHSSCQSLFLTMNWDALTYRILFAVPGTETSDYFCSCFFIIGQVHNETPPRDLRGEVAVDFFWSVKSILVRLLHIITEKSNPLLTHGKYNPRI